MERTVPFLNGCISFISFISALSLVVYMLVVFVSGIFDISLTVFSTVFIEPTERQRILSEISQAVLHTFAFLLILIQVFRLFIEFMRSHVLSVQHTIELVIVVTVLELLFNSQAYPEQMQLVLAGAGVIFSAIYAFGYKNLALAAKGIDKTSYADSLVEASTPVSEEKAIDSAPVTAVKELKARTRKIPSKTKVIATK